VDSELDTISTCPFSHNSSISNFLMMEVDCEDNNAPKQSSSPPSLDIEKLFTVFTEKIANQIIHQTTTL
jgi:hypothetical protein